MLQPLYFFSPHVAPLGCVVVFVCLCMHTYIYLLIYKCMNERTKIAPQQTAGSSEGTSCLVCSQLLARLLRADAPSAPCGRLVCSVRTPREVPSDESGCAFGRAVAFFSPNYLSEWNKMLIFAGYGEKRDDTIL